MNRKIEKKEEMKKGIEKKRNRQFGLGRGGLKALLCCTVLEY